MNDDTFIFLDEFLDTELYIFLNKCKEEILKFVWKDKNIEIIYGCKEINVKII